MMKELILLILFFFILQRSQAQQAVVALPAMNVIYIGLDNPVAIAVEGYYYKQLTISTKNCLMNGTYPNTYLVANTVSPYGCIVSVSYKSGKKTLTETKSFRIKNFPKPESMFGTLESGYYPASAVLGQSTIRALWPGVIHEILGNSIISYQWTFIGNSVFNTCFEKEKSASISEKLKGFIRNSKPGDAIIIDQIMAIGPGGIKMLLDSIEITITDKNPSHRLYNFLIFSLQNAKSETTFHHFGDSVFCCNSDDGLPDGILRKYNLEFGDSILLFELKYAEKKLVWIKEFYKNKNLKIEYNFERNDTIGQAISYYENGIIKAKGDVMADITNIRKYYFFENSDPDSISKILDRFLLLNFAPVGKWKGYYLNGNTAFECNLILKGYKIPFEDGGSLSDGIEEYSIQEVFRYNKTPIFPTLSGIINIYDEQGELISEENFKE